MLHYQLNNVDIYRKYYTKLLTADIRLVSEFGHDLHHLSTDLVTEVLLLQDFICGTVCLLVRDRWLHVAMDSLGIVWKLKHLGDKKS